MKYNVKIISYQILLTYSLNILTYMILNRKLVFCNIKIAILFFYLPKNFDWYFFRSEIFYRNFLRRIKIFAVYCMNASQNLDKRSSIISFGHYADDMKSAINPSIINSGVLNEITEDDKTLSDIESEESAENKHDESNMQYDSFVFILLENKILINLIFIAIKKLNIQK